MSVKHINPDTLIQNPAFTNVIEVTGKAKTIYIGGQDAVDTSGEIVGKGNFKKQLEQVYHNLQAALTAAGNTSSSGMLMSCRGKTCKMPLKLGSVSGAIERIPSYHSHRSRWSRQS